MVQVCDLFQWLINYYIFLLLILLFPTVIRIIHILTTLVIAWCRTSWKQRLIPTLRHSLKVLQLLRVLKHPRSGRNPHLPPNQIERLLISLLNIHLSLLILMNGLLLLRIHPDQVILYLIEIYIYCLLPLLLLGISVDLLESSGIVFATWRNTIVLF